MHPNDELVSPPRPRRKWLKWGLLLLVPVLALGGAFLFSYLSARSDWQVAVAEATQDDPHWQFADRQARRATWKDEENGALVARSAKALIPKEWPAWDYFVPAAQPNPGNTNEGPANAPRADEERQALQESFSNLELPVQLQPRQVAALKEEFKKAEQAAAEARRLAQFPRGRFPIQYQQVLSSTLMPDIQDARAIANLLGYDMLLRAQENDLAGALTSCQALLHLCRYLDEEPTLIPLLVRIAIRSIALRRLERLLAQGEPDAAELARLQKILEEEEALPSLLDALRGERGGGDMMMAQLESGQMTVGKVAVPGGSPFDKLFTLVPGVMRQQRASLLRVNNRVVALVQLPFEQRKAEEAQFTQDIPNMPVLARLLVPAHQKVIEAADRGLAELRCALVMLAAERYRRAHGRWPANLEALTPQFLDKVCEDPFDGKPLRLRAMADGIVIYSVGLDGADDGGKLSKNPMDKGTDLGIRLYDVPQRRQPAKP